MLCNHLKTKILNKIYGSYGSAYLKEKCLKCWKTRTHRAAITLGVWKFGKWRSTKKELIK